MKRVWSGILLAAMLLGCIGLFCACKASTPAVGASRLLSAVLKTGGYAFPDRLCGWGNEDYDLQFDAYYGISRDLVSDGALAYCSGLRADEISLLVAARDRDVNTVKDALTKHADAEYQNYSKYDPVEAAKLKKAEVFTYGRYVFLVVSEDVGGIRKTIDSLLKDPDSIPAFAGFDETGSTTESESETESGSKEGMEYDFSVPVPESGEVGEAWLEDAVFIGDSRLYGIYYYLKPSLYRNLSYESLSINGVFSKEIAETPDGKVTVSDALGAYPDFKKCYLMFGVNELGWPSTDTFVNYYARLIDRIREVNPDAQIYLLAIYPVEEAKVSDADIFSNARIRGINAKLLALAAQKRVYYVDTFSVLDDGAGGLAPGSTNDGIHVGPSACRTLLGYILTHTVQPE